MRLRQLRGWMVRLFGIFNRARRNLAILQFVIADCGIVASSPTGMRPRMTR